MQAVGAGEEVLVSDDQHRFGYHLEPPEEFSDGGGAVDFDLTFRVAENHLHGDSTAATPMANDRTMPTTTIHTIHLTSLWFRMVPHSTAPILVCMNLLQQGITRSFRGLRTGDPGLLALGAAMLFVGWLRKSRPARKRVYRQRLRPGHEVRIRFVEPGEG